MQSVFAQFIQRRQLVILRFLVFTTMVVLCAPVRSDIIVDVQNASIAASGTGFVDVLISSDGTDDLASVGYLFEITGSSANGELRFRPTPEQSNSEQNVDSPNKYIFYDDKDPGNFFATAQTDTLYEGSDATLSGNNVPLAAVQRLLVRLELVHVSPTPEAAVLDTFTISFFNDDNGTPQLDDDLAQFLDAGGNNIAIASSTSGTITITSAAVPEPGTLGVLLAGSTVGLWWKRRKLRRKQNSDHE